MALVGNTVLLSSEFPQEAGDLSQLTNVRVKIYTTELKLLQDLGEPTKISDGKYEIKYTVTGSLYPNPLVYEFSGQIGNNVYLGREQIFRTKT